MNQLYKASSPYLLQHAHHPVHWYEWSNEVLEKAAKEDKPLLISIGYAACHWCHVMARESFMNNEVAELMNAHFICIKIDREERPDIDHVYMEAVQMIKGNGGWPLNAFALPNGKPFYAGTYFPSHQWKSLLLQIHQLYQNEYPKLVDEAIIISQKIQKQQLIGLIKTGEKSELNTLYTALFNQWKSNIDVLRGGFGAAPKFPLPAGWNFLLEFYQNTNNEEVLKAVNNTLTAMAKGGIYDQIGGGFARYSVDAYWRVPHFEKMLYDNGQLVSLYSKVYLVDKNPLYKKVIEQSLAFIERELMDSSGGFYASLNADSEGDEGTFYVFTKTEIEQNFDADIAKFIINYYHFTENGNWEHHKNVLFTNFTTDLYAEKYQLEKIEVEQLMAKSEQALFKYRNNRIKPTTDSKILTAWNALMLQGFIDAFISLENQQYLYIALKNAQFLTDNLLKKDGSLWRNYKDGKAAIDGFLEDYALFAEGLLNLYQITLNIQWLNISKMLMDYGIQYFYNQENGFFSFTSNKSESLYIKKYEVFDNVIPSSNAVMAHVLYRLGLLYDDSEYTSIAEKMVTQMTNQINKSGPYTGKWASLVGFMVSGSPILAIIGSNAVDFALELKQKTNSTNLICGGTTENLPFFKNKLIHGKTAIYSCKNNTCSLPMYSVEEFVSSLPKYPE